MILFVVIFDLAAWNFVIGFMRELEDQ